MDNKWAMGRRSVGHGAETLPSGAPRPSAYSTDRAKRATHRRDPLTTSKRGAGEEQTKPVIFKLGPADYQLAINKELGPDQAGAHDCVFAALVSERSDTGSFATRTPNLNRRNMTQHNSGAV